MRVLAGEQVLGRREVGQAERGELRLRAQLGVDQFGLHLGSAAQAPVDLDIAQLGLVLDASSQPQGDRGHRQPDHGDDPADDLDDRAEVGDAEGLEDDRATGQQDPEHDQHDRDARQGPPRRLGRHLELDRDLVLQDRLQLADRRVEGAQPLDAAAQHADRGWATGAWSRGHGSRR